MVNKLVLLPSRLLHSLPALLFANKFFSLKGKQESKLDGINAQFFAYCINIARRLNNSIFIISSRTFFLPVSCVLLSTFFAPRS
jgi:hypothetical protein